MIFKSEVDPNIYVRVLKDSISPEGDRLFSIHAHYPRIILSELNTHKILSKNSSSCLSGDTLITIESPSMLIESKHRSHSPMTIKEIVDKWFDGAKKRKRFDYQANLDDRNNTAKEISKILNITSPSNIRRLCRNGTIPIKNQNKKRWEDFVINGLDYNHYHNGLESVSQDMKSRLRKMKLRCLNEETGEFITTSIVDCFRQGIQDIYEVTLDNGYILKCTDSHRIFTEAGFRTLKDIGLIRYESGLVIYDDNHPKIATNGFQISEEWLRSQRELGKNLVEISKEFNLNYKSIAYFAQKFKISFSKRKETLLETFEYKDKSWLQLRISEGLYAHQIAAMCNSTTDRVKKQIQKFKLVANRWNWGCKEVWNKGKKYTISEDKLLNIRNHAKNRRKLGSYTKYKDILAQRVRFISENKRSILEKFNFKCAISGGKYQLELHHIDPVWNNPDRCFDITNLIPLSKHIHKLIHAKHLELELLEYYNDGKDLRLFLDSIKDVIIHPLEINKPIGSGNKLVVRYSKIKSIKYIGKQETYDIEVSGKFRNFIANGIVVHNSRAVPVNNFLETIESMPFIPSFLQKNKSGMQSTEDLSEVEKKKVVKLIKNHLKATAKLIRTLSDKEGLNLHKQFVNRYSEVFQYMNTVITGSEWDSKLGTFLKLRNHQDADPHFHELAKCIQLAYNNSKPELLLPGEWHLPFVDSQRDDSGKVIYSICNRETLTVNEVTLEEAKKISASCCAQISYRKEDNSLDKANDIFDRLIYSDPEHSSPLEHQGTPIDYNLLKDDSKKAFDIIGITHMDRLYNLWSANFKGWVMYRKELEQLKEINRLS